MLECVVNISEGQDVDVLTSLASALEADSQGCVLDLHSDPDHHRSVFTLVGTDAPRLLTRDAVARLSLHSHDGVHPRLGVVDVVPFVPLSGSSLADAQRARDEFAHWAADELALPVFIYGPERSLPEIRRRAWNDLQPDHGPRAPHPTAGAVCVGARDLLVAWNVWLSDATLAVTRQIAAAVRTNDIRTLGLQVGAFTQVSINLVNPLVLGPDIAYDAVVHHARRAGATVVRSELVGLAPRDMLHTIDRERWAELDLSENTTIESRLASRPTH